MSWNKFLFVVCLFSFCNHLNAESAADEEYPGWQFVSPEIKEKCQSMENILLPSQDIPDSKALEALKGCDADDLYYGFMQAPDYVKARQCAQANKAYDILTMLYANGKGVNRNLDVAVHYACKYGGAPAELEGRVKHLIELKNTGKQAKDFDICDDITSGYMMGQCTAIESRFKDEKRKKLYASLMSNWNSQERKAFEPLQKAFAAYLEARMGEIDVSGTARASLQIGEENSLKDRFLKTLEECTQGKLPPFMASHYKEADKQLNILYKKARNKKYFMVSGINSEGIQATQKAWLKYRDAWVVFGCQKCPKVSKDSWKTILTNERIEELKSLTEMESEE